MTDNLFADKDGFVVDSVHSKMVCKVLEKLGLDLALVSKCKPTVVLYISPHHLDSSI